MFVNNNINKFNRQTHIKLPKQANYSYVMANMQHTTDSSGMTVLDLCELTWYPSGCI